MGAVFVFLGGGIGSVIRYAFGVLFSKTDLTLPIATLFSNLSSCILLALSLLFLNEKFISQPNMKLFIITGLCGGLSTFSTFSFETFQLIKEQHYVWATSNIILSIFLCLAIFFTFISKLA